MKKQVVNNISKLLQDRYVFPDTAKRMSTRINDRLQSGSYTAISEPSEFADKLLEDLHSVYHDGHLIVTYNPSFNTPQNNFLPAADENNYGFKKAEVLNGNIGYINLTAFSADGEEGMNTIRSAMGFLKNTKAIIIDVRNNGGGSQEVATNIMSFFFKERTHVERFYERATNTTTDYWTKPMKGLEKLHDIPLYILTSKKSFSCAEMLAYDLQALHRATIIGEVTGGGAHGQFMTDVTNGFVMQIPYWRSINPITKTNWESVGVTPDISTDAEHALEIAELEILKKLAATAVTEVERFRLNWQADLLLAINHPVTIDSTVLKEYAGMYGERLFTFENGALYYQRSGRPRFLLEAMTQNLMKGKGNDYFRIEFVRNEQGKVAEVKAYYQDNRMESSKRTDQR